MRDSEPSVNGPASSVQVHETDSEPLNRGKLPKAMGDQDPIVSRFIRIKIEEWGANGHQDQELAKLGGFSKSTVAQVKKGTGVGKKTVAKWAKALGFPSVGALYQAALAWSMGQGNAVEARMLEEEVRKAIEMLLIRHPMATKQMIRTIMAAFTDPRFDGRTADDWVDRLNPEVRRDVSAAEAAKAQEEAEKRSKKAAQKAAKRLSNQPDK